MNGVTLLQIVYVRVQRNVTMVGHWRTNSHINMLVHTLSSPAHFHPNCYRSWFSRSKIKIKFIGTSIRDYLANIAIVNKLQMSFQLAYLHLTFYWSRSSTFRLENIYEIVTNRVIITISSNMKSSSRMWTFYYLDLTLADLKGQLGHCHWHWPLAIVNLP